MDADTALPSLAAKPKTSDPTPPRRPFSLAARAALATGFVLAAFLGVVGLTLTRTAADSALKGLQDRLQNFVVAYLAGTEVGRSGKVLLPDTPPDPSFSRPGSGLYAVAIGDNGFKWESPSAIGRDFGFLKPLEPGEGQFVGPVDTRMGRLYYYTYGVALDTAEKKSVHLTFMVAQTEDQLEGRNAVFRRSLIFWLASLGVMLILLQMLLLRWSLTPLRKVANEMSRVELGEREHLGDQYPAELTGLTERINAFIDSEREQRVRTRNTLADLAHSLKTPLAVLQGVGDQLAEEPGNREQVRVLQGQIERMSQQIGYQLQRASLRKSGLVRHREQLAPLVETLCDALDKVYRDKRVSLQRDFSPSFSVPVERGALLELLGNLLENAYRLCLGRVRVGARLGPGYSELWVEDDGPGVPAEQRARIIRRGERADTQHPGQGIGLAVALDIIESYDGELSLDDSELGGACFRIRFATV